MPNECVQYTIPGRPVNGILAWNFEFPVVLGPGMRCCIFMFVRVSSLGTVYSKEGSLAVISVQIEIYNLRHHFFGVQIPSHFCPAFVFRLFVGTKSTGRRAANSLRFVLLARNPRDGQLAFRFVIFYQWTVLFSYCGRFSCRINGKGGWFFTIVLTQSWV